MRSKLDYLITLSLKRKMKTKWFLITNILVAILIIGLINIDSIITLFGGDFNKKTKLYVIDNTNEAYELFKTELDNSSKLLNEESGYEVYRYDKTIDDAMEELKEKDNYDNYYLEFSYLDDYSLKVKLVTKEYIDIYDTQILNNALNMKSNEALRQRIITSYNIGTMSIEESCIYIKTKLSNAGSSSDIFTPQALRAIASYSSGNPRVISRVCDLALMIANKIDKSNIDEEVANLAINEINM